MQNALRKNIGMSEYKYFSEFSRKLVTSKINPTCHWSILKSFLNKKKSLYTSFNSYNSIGRRF